ncbi:Uncharacterised protein [Amycolatopsis camponoti]|uniref:Uncharacterized protein n=1 Tax=Amycolatopsis camponoti TaxID=2606593 RepID=A0A6I8MC49_9PSEU|nr:hypothetical protein [Amycolatopsis camponoti]VVJ25420.1 Uncharacterised protein [Amycolatopsis camponoti]
MPKLKDIALGIIVAPLLIPIMLIASYQDKKALKKDQNKLPKDQASLIIQSNNQKCGTLQ